MITPENNIAINAVKETYNGVKSFLKVTCEPALTELGQMLKDKVRIWRLNNVLKVIEKSKDKFEFKDGEINIKFHPKVALAIIEGCSNEEDDNLQNMWAGLLSTSISYSDGNLIYVNLLKQLTVAEVRILNYACEQSTFMQVGKNYFVHSGTFTMDKFKEITGIDNENDIQSICLHLISLKLGVNPYNMDNQIIRQVDDDKTAVVTAFNHFAG